MPASLYNFGMNELTSRKSRIYKALFAEFLGMLILNFFGCGACLFGDKLQISMTNGILIFILIVSLEHVSGCHVNPAITLAILAVGKISVIRGLLYVVVQLCGAYCGTAALRAFLPDKFVNGVGHPYLISTITPLQAVGLEFFLGFILLFIVFATMDENKPGPKVIGPLANGFTVIMGNLSLMHITGASMNPARSFGTAAIYGIWENHWLYWLGPVFGGIAAGLVYTQILSAPEPDDYPMEKFKTVLADEKEMTRFDTKA